MTESTQVEPSGDGLVLDTTKQYKTNAGQCAQAWVQAWAWVQVLPDFKNEAIITTMASVDDGFFPSWEKLL
nr:hypothetical protein [Candidatus Sigynarchaeota archaeon]